MDKRLKILTVLTAIAIMTVTVVYASYWIYSKVMSIMVSNYTISLSVSATGLNITLSGYVRAPNGTGIPNKTVYVYRTYSNGTEIVLVGSPTTDSQGYYICSWLAPANGTYYFRSRCLVP